MLFDILADMVFVLLFFGVDFFVRDIVNDLDNDLVFVVRVYNILIIGLACCFQIV